MTVYFAQTRIDPTKVKIGFTSDLEARRGNMSVSVPGGISILATLNGNKETEGYLHEKFAAHNVGGEWFTLSDELADFIRDVQNGKKGLVPFKDEARYFVRSTSDYAKDALDAAREMYLAILDHEYRGVGDTVSAAMGRVEKRHGIKCTLGRKLRYRHEKPDIWAGEYLHIKTVFEALTHARRESDRPLRVSPTTDKEKD